MTHRYVRRAPFAARCAAEQGRFRQHGGAVGNNVLLAHGDVRSNTVKAEAWRNNVFAGAWSTWPQGKGNNVAPGLQLLDGSGLERLLVKTESVIGVGQPIFQALDEGHADSQIPEGVDPVVSTCCPCPALDHAQGSRGSRTLRLRPTPRARTPRGTSWPTPGTSSDPLTLISPLL